MSIYDFKVRAQNGSEVSLSDYKGKPSVQVVTALLSRSFQRWM